MVQDFVQRAAPLSDRAAVDALGVPYALAVRELSEVFAAGSDTIDKVVKLPRL